jgi:hypothetical protein
LNFSGLWAENQGVLYVLGVSFRLLLVPPRSLLGQAVRSPFMVLPLAGKIIKSSTILHAVTAY